MIVLDASVLIGHFESTDVHHRRASRLLTANAAEEFASSAVTLAELYVGAARAGRSDRLTELIRRLGVRALELPAEAAQRLGAIRAATGLKLPDCCVLYAAETSRAAVATFDRPLAARARECGLTVVDSPAPA